MRRRFPVNRWDTEEVSNHHSTPVSCLSFILKWVNWSVLNSAYRSWSQVKLLFINSSPVCILQRLNHLFWAAGKLRPLNVKVPPVFYSLTNPSGLLCPAFQCRLFTIIKNNKFSICTRIRKSCTQTFLTEIKKQCWSESGLHRVKPAQV